MVSLRTYVIYVIYHPLISYLILLYIHYPLFSLAPIIGPFRNGSQLFILYAIKNQRGASKIPLVGGILRSMPEG